MGTLSWFVLLVLVIGASVAFVYYVWKHVVSSALAALGATLMLFAVFLQQWLIVDQVMSPRLSDSDFRYYTAEILGIGYEWSIGLISPGMAVIIITLSIIGIICMAVAFAIFVIHKIGGAMAERVDEVGTKSVLPEPSADARAGGVV